MSSPTNSFVSFCFLSSCLDMNSTLLNKCRHLSARSFASSLWLSVASTNRDKCRQTKKKNILVLLHLLHGLHQMLHQLHSRLYVREHTSDLLNRYCSSLEREMENVDCIFDILMHGQGRQGEAMWQEWAACERKTSRGVPAMLIHFLLSYLPFASVSLRLD